MSENLNQNLYSRFGLQLNVELVQDGCKKYFKGLLVNILGPITTPNSYKKSAKLWNIQSAVLDKVCRQLFLDSDDWYGTDYESGLKRLIEHEISDDFSGSFVEYLLRLQILVNTVAEHDSVRYKLDQLVVEIDKYFNDFPILGHTIKIYKTKPPQILPSTSKRLDKEIMDTLGVLDTEQFKSVLNDFEAGLKIFANAKTDSQLKDVVEDMHASCDEIVKIVLNDKNKSFKHAADKVEHKRLGLGGHQKEIFKNLKNLMDEIKHGSKKNIDRDEVEMIISMSAAFIRFVAVKHK